MNIVIVGHIDHGKSTLIGRILFDTKSIPDSVVEDVKAASKAGEINFAYFLDCLQEERAKDITIDTTQTFFKSGDRRYVIIDAPGHKEFLKNMVSGASLATTAVLLLDVERGMEEQTKRHAYVLTLLGIKQIIVAVNKMDSVNFSEEKFLNAQENIVAFFSKLGIKPLAVLPIAAKTGDNVVTHSKNLPWFQDRCLLEVLDSIPDHEASTQSEVRFPVQDVYDFVDGTPIIVGRVESGILKQGAEVTFAPSGIKSKIEAIKIFEGTKTSAGVGECIGVTLNPPVDVTRGLVAFAGNSPQTSKSLKTVIFSLAENSLAKGAKLSCQCGTLAVDCEITSIENKIDSSTLEAVDTAPDALEPTQVAKVTLSFAKPLVYDEFQTVPGLGRFILTQNGDTCAAGIIQTAV